MVSKKCSLWGWRWESPNTLRIMTTSMQGRTRLLEDPRLLSAPGPLIFPKGCLRSTKIRAATHFFLASRLPRLPLESLEAEVAYAAGVLVEHLIDRRADRNRSVGPGCGRFQLQHLWRMLLGCSDSNFLPTNGFSIKPLKVELLAGEQKATET